MRSLSLFIVLMFLSSFAFGDDQVFSIIVKAPKVSMAKIKRGTTEIRVDLSQKIIIKDYDVILLEEGVYSTLGNFKAKYVRVIGKGQRKTFISTSTPINVNSTEFWDVTIADAQFKIVDVSGLWAVNVEFAGAILVKPASEDKSPAFTIRSVFSSPNNDLTVESPTTDKLLAYEDKLDRDETMNLKDRMAQKGLVARGANYLFQMKNLKPHYDHAKYNELTKRAKTAKTKGHIYVSMVTWAEADRMSAHSRFDEVLREITPLQQKVGQECGCSVEGQGLAITIKTEIEQKLYARLPITSLPGPCKIQALHVNATATADKEKAIASARLESQLAKTASYRASEFAFQSSVIAHSGTKAPSEDDFTVGSEAMVETKPVLPKKYLAVADVSMPGLKKTFSSDVNGDKNFITENIVNPIAKAFTDQFASKIKAATAKIASSDIFTKMDGFLVAALYGDDLARQNSYEDLHEQQFGRKMSAPAVMSSVLSY